MRRDIYRELQEHLEKIGIGFPATASGIEIKILKTFFSEEDAAMFLKMGELPETPRDVAQRIGKDTASVAGDLERMAKDGLLFRIIGDGQPKYFAAPFLIGIWENKIKVIDRDFSQLMERYFEEKLSEHNSRTFEKTHLLKIIPVEQAVDALQAVSNYDRNRAHIKSKKSIAITECVCRTQKNFVGEGCGRPLETCMVFDWYADYFVKNGQGRRISMQEALEIQDRCEENGLVSLAANLEDIYILCHCCGCCCMGLSNIKKHPKPSGVLVCNFFAVVDTDICAACGTCQERCPMDAIAVDAPETTVNPDRCIGCGVCVAACPEGALRLEQKTEVERPMDPVEAGRRLAQSKQSAA